MQNIVELLLRLKPEWERAYQEYLKESEREERLSADDVTRFLEIMLENHLTGDTKSLMILLDDWLLALEDEPVEPVAFEKYQELSLISALHTLRAILSNVTLQQVEESDLLAIQAVIEPFFGNAVEYIAYTEATENLMRAQRRQKEVQDALERLDESRANFVSIAAHGLKTPLTLVEGYSKMLAEQLGQQQEEAMPLLAGIESGTDRMRELIDDLVDVAMIDNKMLSLYYQPLRLNEMIDRVIGQFSQQIKDKSIRLVRDQTEQFEKTIFADRERLVQAFVEIVDNAVKYSPPEGKIFINGRTLPGFLEISVTDSGVGISPENQARIFEQFSSASERKGAPDDSYESLGSGLGLHLSKGIIEAHGGAIWVDSPGYDPDRCPGSTFHLMIPDRAEPPDDPSMRLLGKPRK